MEFLAPGSIASKRGQIRQLLLKVLSEADDACIATAYFSPDETVSAALQKVKSLKLIVSNEWQINNPYKLEKLAAAIVKVVPIDADEGKLHAKVFIVKRRDGTVWVLLGSANLTGSGMCGNQEVCLALDSANTNEQPILQEIQGWFALLLKRSRIPDWHSAKKIFKDSQRSRFAAGAIEYPENDAGYWALKTTSGSTGENHWDMFKADSVIAIGWEQLEIDESEMLDKSMLTSAILKAYPGEGLGEAKAGAASIKKFVELKVGARLLICQGYVSNQSKHVYVYGTALVNRPFRAEPRREGGGWRFKHDADIQVIEKFVPRDEIATALNKGSLRQAIHRLDQGSFERVTKLIRPD